MKDVRIRFVCSGGTAQSEQHETLVLQSYRVSASGSVERTDGTDELAASVADSPEDADAGLARTMQRHGLNQPQGRANVKCPRLGCRSNPVLNEDGLRRLVDPYKHAGGICQVDIGTGAIIHKQ